jgi:hypothetical protein
VVTGHDMALDFIGASPCKTAERALASRLMYVLQVPLELLDPYKISIAICASRSHPTARASTFSMPLRSLDNHMLSRVAGWSLGYISMHRITGSLVKLASYTGK